MRRQLLADGEASISIEHIRTCALFDLPLSLRFVALIKLDP